MIHHERDVREDCRLSVKFRAWRSGFLIATKWCCDQDVKVCQVQPSQKEYAIGTVHCKKEKMLLQPLSWRFVESAIHHERNVRDE